MNNSHEKVKRLADHAWWGIHTETRGEAWNPVIKWVSNPVWNGVDPVESSVWDQLDEDMSATIS